MITKQGNQYKYSTTQTSSLSTVDMFWDIVNNRYINIANKVSYAYDVCWIDGCITDIEHGIHHCQYIQDTKLRKAYIQQFNCIRNELNTIKKELIDEI